MNVIELRNKLNKIITEGKSEYKVMSTDEYEINNICEGKIYIWDTPLSGIEEVTIDNDMLNVYKKSFELLGKKGNYIKIY